MPITSITESTFHAGRIAINYGEAVGTGPAIVMLHGMTGDWRGFRDLMNRLAGGWHSYACDLRGHGKSGRDEGNYRLPDYAGDIQAFLAEVCGPAVLLGHSLGALVSILAAAEKPELVRGAVLLDPPVYVRNAPLGTHPAVEDWFGWVHETMKDGPTLEQVAEASRLREPDADEKEIQALALRVSRVDPATVGAALQEMLDDGADMEAALAGLRCPTLVLRGEWRCGACVREEDAEWMRATNPALQIVQIPGGSHGFLWEKPEETAELIQGFLDRRISFSN